MKYFFSRTGSLIITDPANNTVTTIQATVNSIAVIVNNEAGAAQMEEKFEEMQLEPATEQVAHDFRQAIFALMKGETGFEVFSGNSNAFHIEENLIKSNANP